MKVSRQDYYKWLGEEPSIRYLKADKLKKVISKIHNASRMNYGRRKIYKTCINHGIPCGKNRVGKIMKQMGIRGRGKKKFVKTTDSRHCRRIFPNLITQDFIAYMPNSLWSSDITYIPTKEGWLYLCIILDCFARAIVRCSMSEKINTELVTSAINQAHNFRKPQPGLIFHSDRGSQYASHAVVILLKITMSNNGNCYDNAIFEPLFLNLLKCFIIEFASIQNLTLSHHLITREFAFNSVNYSGVTPLFDFFFFLSR
jgi:putative transposase